MLGADVKGEICVVNDNSGICVSIYFLNNYSVLASVACVLSQNNSLLLSGWYVCNLSQIKVLHFMELFLIQ